jgi:uncharacterized protein YdeI (YjbR/CyaY-like superfamily)
MNVKADTYFTHGCGRCALGGTPQCKVHNWEEELAALRALLLNSELSEECKWGVPCYTFNNANVILLTAFKEYCALAFVKGTLLKDAYNILEKPGENTQGGRVVKITQLKQVKKLKPVLKMYIHEAVELEKSGRKVIFKKNPEKVPDELQAKLDKNAAFKKAFYALTPGRQRGYILFFSAARQKQTREARIEKCMPQILKGKGLHD